MFDWSIFGPERGPRIRCRAVGNISDGYGSFDIWGKSTMVRSLLIVVTIKWIGLGTFRGNFKVVTCVDGPNGHE